MRQNPGTPPRRKQHFILPRHSMCNVMVLFRFTKSNSSFTSNPSKHTYLQHNNTFNTYFLSLYIMLWRVFFKRLNYLAFNTFIHSHTCEMKTVFPVPFYFPPKHSFHISLVRVEGLSSWDHRGVGYLNNWSEMVMLGLQFPEISLFSISCFPVILRGDLWGEGIQVTSNLCSVACTKIVGIQAHKRNAPATHCEPVGRLFLWRVTPSRDNVMNQALGHLASLTEKTDTERPVTKTEAYQQRAHERLYNIQESVHGGEDEARSFLPREGFRSAQISMNI